jgi:hypothetical protein
MAYSSPSQDAKTLLHRSVLGSFPGAVFTRKQHSHVPSRLPTHLDQLPKSFGDFNQDCTSRVWIRCATHNPRITVVTDDNCFVCVCTVDDADDVPDGRCLFFHEVCESEGGTWSGSGAVCCVEAADPIAFANDFTVAVQSLEERQGVSIGYGQRRDPGEVWGIAETLDSGFGCVARCCRVSGVLVDVDD